jgi:predicted flap endonuclease-1-like 5' DNA nuclease
MAWVEANLLWVVIGAAVLLALLGLLWLRRPSQPQVERAAQPAAPLQPVKPDIMRAQPAQFAASPVAEPVPAPPVPPPAAPASVAPAEGPPAGATDNLALLKGVGPKLVALLAGLGVTRFDQIAAWSEADIAAIDARLGTFAGRITRDNWVDQAGFLARGDKAGFEAKYGALGGEL